MGFLLLPSKASSTEIKLPVIEFLTKGSHRNPQGTQHVVNTASCSPQTDSKPSLLKTTLTELIEHGEF